jgi:hypothetical protein
MTHNKVNARHVWPKIQFRMNGMEFVPMEKGKSFSQVFLLVICSLSLSLRRAEAAATTIAQQQH